MARVVGEVRPKYVFVENSPMLTTRGGTRVIGDLAEMGYDCKWTVMGAADVGANHQRDRMWIVAKWCKYISYAQHDRIRRWKQQQKSAQESQMGKSHCRGLEIQWANSGQQEAAQFRDASSLAYTSSIGLQRLNKCGSNGQSSSKGIQPEFAGSNGSISGWWQAEPNVGRVADGVAARVDRLKAIGNGQVPLCAATAWKLLTA